MSNLPSLEERIVFLLTQVAEFTRPCKKCAATLYFVKGKNSDKLIPFTRAGVVHFVDCPYSTEFRKQKAGTAHA